MLKPCCRNLFKFADLFCHLASSFNRTAHLHTRQSWHKTGLLPTAVNSLLKMNGLRTRLTSTLWSLDYYVWGAMLECYKSFQPKPKNIDELKKVLQLIWDQLPQDSINKAILSFPKRLRGSGLCESWWWTLRTYAKMNYLLDFGPAVKVKRTYSYSLHHAARIQ